MTRSIRIGEIGSYCENQVEQLLRATVLETDRRLKERSPVDTGRFRFSWQIGENTTGIYDAGPQQPSDPSSKTRTSPPASPAPPLARGVNYTPTFEKLGNVYSIHNSLPYAEPLAQGHSSQAPAGWLDLVAREMQSNVSKNWERIRRQG
jgi:hypothetical protein